MKVRNIMFTGFMAAILSATGAHAAISVASQAYVDKQVKANADAIALKADASTVSDLDAAYKAADETLQNAIDAKVSQADYDAKVQALEAADDTFATKALVGTIPEGATATDVVGYVQEKTSGIATEGAMTELGNRVTAAEKDIDDLQAADTEIRTSITDITKEGGAIATAIAGKADTTTVNEELAKKVNKADAALAQVGADGSYIKFVSQADGKVSATDAAFDAKVEDGTTSSNAPTSDAVKSYVQTKFGALSDSTGELSTSLETLTGRVVAAEGDIDDLLSSKANAADVYTKTEADAAIADAKKAGTDAAAALEAYETSNDAALAGVKATAEAAQTAEEVQAAITAAVTGEAGALKDYSTTSEVEGLISTAKTEAVNAAAADATTKANTAESNAKAYTDQEIDNLNLAALSRVPAECSVTGKYCVLTSDGTNYLWEVIERATDEAQPSGSKPIPSED